MGIFGITRHTGYNIRHELKKKGIQLERGPNGDINVMPSPKAREFTRKAGVVANVVDSVVDVILGRKKLAPTSIDDIDPQTHPDTVFGRDLEHRKNLDNRHNEKRFEDGYNADGPISGRVAGRINDAVDHAFGRDTAEAPAAPPAGYNSGKFSWEENQPAQADKPYIDEDALPVAGKAPLGRVDVTPLADIPATPPPPPPPTAQDLERMNLQPTAKAAEPVAAAASHAPESASNILNRWSGEGAAITKYGQGADAAYVAIKDGKVIGGMVPHGLNAKGDNLGVEVDRAGLDQHFASTGSPKTVASLEAVTKLAADSGATLQGAVGAPAAEVGLNAPAPAMNYFKPGTSI